MNTTIISTPMIEEFFQPNEFMGSWTRAVSDETEKYFSLMKDIIRSQRQNTSFIESFSPTIDDLFNIKEACSCPDWDGYGSDPINDESYALARRFIEDLPTREIPAPEVSIDPDGEVVFDWFGEPCYTFSISFGTDKLTYAGLYGNNKTHGTEEYGENIPQIILQNINKVYQ